MRGLGIADRWGFLKGESILRPVHRKVMMVSTVAERKNAVLVGEDAALGYALSS